MIMKGETGHNVRKERESMRSAAWCAQQLQEGKLLVLPTETVYGLAASPWLSGSIDELYRIKKRPSAMPLILHYASYEEALRDIQEIPMAWRLAEIFMPGPLTLIVPAVWPCRLSGILATDPSVELRKTLAIRVPSHPFFQEVAHRFAGPIAASSANLSGQVPLVEHEDLSAFFEPQGVAVVPVGPSPLGLASTILSLENPQAPRLLREGSLKRKQLEEVIHCTIL